MKKSTAICLGALTILFFIPATKADVIADWTFESSQPTSAGPFAPEIGNGQAVANTGGTISDPVGNDSQFSFASTGWDVGDNFEFSVSTIGFENITISFDQTSSAAGPIKFNLDYSLDGTTFTTFATDYLVRTNGASTDNVGSGINTSGAWASGSARTGYSYAFDLSSVVSLNDAATIYFELVDDSSTSATGNPITGSGKDRVDNFTVNGISAAPEPSTFALAVLGSLAGFFALRRRV